MQKTAQVMFFPLKWFPPYQEIERLKELQEHITLAHAEIAYHARYDKYEIMLRKQQLANKMRESFHIVKNTANKKGD
jgi:hypothetical protein